MNPLTENAIQLMLNEEDLHQPIVQLLSYKKMTSAESNSDRYRLLLSDGKKLTTSVLLASQLNYLITSGELENFAIIKLEKYYCNVISPEKKVIMIGELKVLKPGKISQKIGNPEPYTQASAQSNSKQSNETSKPTSNLVNNSSNVLKNSSNNYIAKDFNPNKDKTLPTNKKENYSVTQNIGPTNPIASLTPYQNKWSIKVRVTAKSAIKTWSNSRGEGKLFNMELLDDSGEIKATCFNEECDKFYPLIEIGKVYYISKASIKAANKAFNNLNNDYELTLNSDTSIVPCYDSSETVPNVKYNLVAIKDIVDLEKDKFIDIMGIVTHISELQTVISRTLSKELKKREITLLDLSSSAINVTFWASDAEALTSSDAIIQPYETILAIKSARISDFNGKSLSLTQSSSYQINPLDTLPIETAKLRDWFKSNKNASITNISENAAFNSTMNGGMGATPFKLLSQVRDEHLGQSEKPDYFAAKATITFFKRDNCLYQACPSSDCNKKIIDLGNGKYRCEKCIKDYSEFQWRLLLSISIADFTGTQWVTAFQDTAEAILGVSAQTLGDLKADNQEAFMRVFEDATFKTFIFKLRAKVEVFNVETRLKVICVSAKPVDFIEETKRITEELQQMGITPN